MSNKHPWWYPFAKLGQWIGPKIKLFSGVAKFFPDPRVKVIGEVVGGVEPFVTGEAEKGVREGK